MKSLAGVVLAILSLLGCATVQQPIKQTASGRAEAEFHALFADEVQGKLVSWCVNHGYTVENANRVQVVCERPLGNDGLMFQALLSGVNSTPPVQRVYFTVASESDMHHRVIVYCTTESVTAFGQLQKVESKAARNDLQRALFEIGGV